MSEMQPISLPSGLDEIAIAQFDDLIARGELFYKPSVGEIVKDQGFTFEFRIAPAVQEKPVLARDDPKRHGSKGGPFTNPDKDFVLTDVGAHHTLIFNKYCATRPAYLLHTKQYALQTDDLDLSDIRAAWAVLKHLKDPNIMIYNCGVDAGASQGHKHMQIFPWDQNLPFELFPDRARSTEEAASNIPNVPHCHFVVRFPEDINPEQILERYAMLLSRVKQTHRLFGNDGEAYNVIMTLKWLCLIPRRHAHKDKIPANSATMIGLVGLRDQAERDGWTKLGFSEHLKYLGYPINGPDV